MIPPFLSLLLGQILKYRLLVEFVIPFSPYIVSKNFTGNNKYLLHPSIVGSNLKISITRSGICDTIFSLYGLSKNFIRDNKYLFSLLLDQILKYQVLVVKFVILLSPYMVSETLLEIINI